MSFSINQVEMEYYLHIIFINHLELQCYIGNMYFHLMPNQKFVSLQNQISCNFVVKSSICNDINHVNSWHTKKNHVFNASTVYSSFVLRSDISIFKFALGGGGGYF